MAVKIRRVGNRNVVTIPRELERHGFQVGAEVAFVPVGDGQVLMVPVERLNDYVRDMGQDIIRRYSRALEKLATYDPTAG